MHSQTKNNITHLGFQREAVFYTKNTNGTGIVQCGGQEGKNNNNQTQNTNR